MNYKQDTTGAGTWDINQTRTHNAANEIQTISGGNTLVSHDRNGCMTKIPKPLDGTAAYTLVYDAWNRLAQVKDDTTVVATYVYDARNHRIKKTVGTVVTLSYFNQNWQEVESIAAGVTTTNVYGLRYIDDVVCRVKNTEVLYALQDTNWNVVALVTPSGVVAERITYDSFGKPTFRDASFAAKTPSSYNWTKTFTGQVYDSESGLMLYRNRYYHTGLGRFITRDPIGYDAKDVNLHRYVHNQPTLRSDASGFVDNGGAQSCCGGKSYDDSVSCCENGVVVSKVSIWVCSRPLDTPWVSWAYPFSWPGIRFSPRHSYVCCGGNNVNCYGVQAKRPDGNPTQTGDLIPREMLAIGECEQIMVCPSKKGNCCNSPEMPWDYGTLAIYHNCNTWANNCWK